MSSPNAIRSLGFILLALALSSSISQGQTPACGNWTVTTNNSQARENPSAAWDPVNHRVLRFGGYNGSYLNDLWSYTLAGGWIQVSPAGPLPSGRQLAGFVYDSVRGRMLLVCGDAGQRPNDVWQLSLSGTPTWSQVATGTPPTDLYGFSTIYDPIRDRVILYGGYKGFYSDVVWALNLAGTPTWTQLSPAGTAPKGRTLHAAIYDPVRDRMVVHGGYNNVTLRDTWQLSLSGTPTWTQLSPLGPAPPLYSAASAYDPVRDRMLIVAGLGASPGDVATSSTWSLSFKNNQPVWFLIPTGGAVFSPRCRHSVVYEPDHDLLLGFNGELQGGSFASDTQRLDCAGGYWLETAGDYGTVNASPQKACYSAGAPVSLSPQPQTYYAFQSWLGDASGNAQPLNVTMDANKRILAHFEAFSLTVITSPAGSGTVTKSPDQPLYTPGSQVTLTASGNHPFLGWSGDASGTTNPLTVTMDAAKTITASFEVHTLTTNVLPAGSGTVNQTLDSPGTITLTAVPSDGYVFWTWSGDATGTNNPLTLNMDADKSVTANFVIPPPACGNWTLTTNVSQSRMSSGAAWDPVNHRVLRFGGQGAQSNYLNDLWSYTTAAGWMQLTPVGSPPSPRNAPGFLYDPVRGRMLVIAGSNANVPPNDVWQLSLSGTPTWSQVSTTGTPPSGRYGFSSIYDPIRDRVLLFGGYLTNEVWELALAGTPTWTKLTPAGTSPTARYGHVAIYDPVRDRMLMHGGYGNSGVLSDTWMFSLSGTPTWTPIAGLGEAPNIALSSAVYDPIRDRMLVVSGYGSGTQGSANAVWSLSLGVQPNWFRVPTGGITPLNTRCTHAAVYDPDDDLILAFNGFTPGGALLTDTKRLDCAGGYWLETGGDYGTVSESVLKACYNNGELVSLTPQPQTDYALQSWLGDASGSAEPLDVTMDANKVILAQFYNTLVGVEDTPVAFALGEIRPNPSRGEVELSYALPYAAHVRLAIYDVTGRQVSLLANANVQAGRHSARWNGLVGGSAAKSGVYFVRYDTPAHNFRARLVLVR